LRAAASWPEAPRPVPAEDLLAERAIAGDERAKRQLVEEIYRPLTEAGSSVLETVTAFLEQASSLEATARLLFVHPNTVRYRLRRVTDVTGLIPTNSRNAFTLRIALTLGRLEPIKPQL
jgi:DNA-binding PucR family transcriptional regulator